MKTKRQRIDSVTEHARISSLASRQIVPPMTVPLDREDMPFFANIIDEFARSEWTPHQLELAAVLARTMADLVREQGLLRDEGSVVTGSLGTPVTNPRRSVVQMHAANILSIRRSLALHARGTKGEPRDVGKRREMAKAIERDTLNADDGDDLIARPN
jgi:hypothetical protein